MATSRLRISGDPAIYSKILLWWGNLHPGYDSAYSCRSCRHFHYVNYKENWCLLIPHFYNFAFFSINEIFFKYCRKSCCIVISSTSFYLTILYILTILLHAQFGTFFFSKSMASHFSSDNVLKKFILFFIKTAQIRHKGEKDSLLRIERGIQHLCLVWNISVKPYLNICEH